ncbi:hypothetical protein M8PIadj_0204 [Bifidobacterium animalis]|uniref:Uncharacterized protein n=2 Tax=Bifidobacterium animalis subsp. lactis TaxID=302911 RepID=B8DVJ0_BIFA0|nr:hypothetical protein BLA_0189 [Bifidobacterium animalis subsp. lactis AD011]AEK29651.1 hypothetical protein BALAC2494_01987 [Bifidobacterium animalis subsp. lactis CNCM I-2494]QIR80230.1 hypothetical protein M8PIadj_0204 [Bifidobacterium animalis]
MHRFVISADCPHDKPVHSRAYLPYEIADSSFGALQADTPWRRV